MCLSGTGVCDNNNLSFSNFIGAFFNTLNPNS